MKMRRTNRAIETFDISLMAVVTKAMGAFLVLMLLMVPSYVSLPDAQRRADDAENKSRQLEEEIADLKRRDGEMQAKLAAGERNRVRVAELQQENKKLRDQTSATQRADSSRKQTAALLIWFNWSGCDADQMDFYVHGEGARLEDGTEWPPVAKGPQQLPAGIVVLKDGGGWAGKTWTYQATTVVTGGLGWYARSLLSAERTTLWDTVHRYTSRLTIWAINHVVQNTTYALYAKTGNLLGSTCDVSNSALLTRQTNGPMGSQPQTWSKPTKSGQVFLMSRITWSGDEFTPTWPTEQEQNNLDRKFGVR